MARNENKSLEWAIAGGLIGAALGAFFTGKSKGAIVSLIAGAAIGASLKALEKAMQTNVPVLFEEKGSLYKLHPNGEKEFIKKIDKEIIDIPETFSLD